MGKGPLVRNAEGAIYPGNGKGQLFFWNGKYMVPLPNLVWDSDRGALKIDGILDLIQSVYEDLQGSALQVEVQGTGVSINADKNTLEFLTSADLNDYGYDNYQLRHAWEIGTVIYPHIHWEQVEDNVPNWLIQYRWQLQGAAKTADWTNYLLPSLETAYSSGTLNQISYGPGITPPEGAGLSDIIQLRVLRDAGNDSGEFTGSDPYTVTASITFIDIHIEQNTQGSSQEYVK